MMQGCHWGQTIWLLRGVGGVEDLASARIFFPTDKQGQIFLQVIRHFPDSLWKPYPFPDFSKKHLVPFSKPNPYGWHILDNHIVNWGEFPWGVIWQNSHIISNQNLLTMTPKWRLKLCEKVFWIIREELIQYILVVSCVQLRCPHINWQSDFFC